MKTLFTTLLLLWTAFSASAQSSGNGAARDQVVTFRFQAGQDMFFIPYDGNDAELNRLYALVDEYRAEIVNGQIPIRVDGYCASGAGEAPEPSFKIAVIRSNRVKSELITNKELAEEHFITKNHATAYEGHRDMVVVTLHIPTKAEQPVQVVGQPKREEPQQEEAVVEQPVVVEQEPEPVVKTQPEQQVIVAKPGITSKPYCFAIRTNLLYDAFLTPTLGVEWRPNVGFGVKLDGSLAHWGDEHGKVQKLWLVSPEVRWYFGQAPRLYVGLGGNVGEYNIYKGMPGGLFSSDTGYQGKLYGGGVTVGYQLYLSHSFSLDFNLGLGYTRLEYDSFNIVNEKRVYKDKNKSKNFWGPTQAGISLVWTIGK